MIEARGLTKLYGSKTALEDVSFDIRPGQVTGFLGPNGAGKSTSMRLMLGLDRPTAGTVTIARKNFTRSTAPLAEVGALLDAKGVHPGRSARSHLRALAATHRIPDSRVDAVLEQAGLTEVAHKRVGGFSLGMGQRLGIAAALLGDPHTVILDEPVNGLDPDGVLWVRRLLRQLASEGRTVLLSSHLMSEMAQTADHLIVLGKGKVVADAPIGELLASSHQASVTVGSPEAAKLVAILLDASTPGNAPHIDSLGEYRFTVTGMSAATVGACAANAGIALHELTPVTATLEDAYLAITRDVLEYETV
ncbi:ABC transporter ATP-binding protein [Leucobacter sp. cx-328]|uniref:ABC transporter ATP-binding protein n=1 Tax=unclassified Leucobacter TaxID=2621730 RepID=UPI00165DE4C4|nr:MULTISPECIES: ABC transporter ATP-binding protein [unclassified Leucobacter]MBC9944070.1 ABC transporter ATP-binding protein [Leucobacter sp. cx-328]